MSNTYFQFKQFRIEQAVGGMKVSTDACILGAVVHDELNNYGRCNVLDIGAGTGLLSLMLAQNDNVEHIAALEIEAAAAAQCRYNFEQSPWSTKLDLINVAVQDFEENGVSLYDIIICNPPFFERHMKSDREDRMVAFHDDYLSKDDLAITLATYLSASGNAYVLYPSSEWALWSSAVERANLYIDKEWHIYPNHKKVHNRIIGRIIKYEVDNKEIVPFYIRNEQQEYSSAFVRLLQPFYLNL